MKAGNSKLPTPWLPLSTALLLIVLGVHVHAGAGAGEAPPGAAGAPPPASELFVASDRCMACHNGLVTPSGEDVSIGTDWRSSMMAQSARDPYWQASVRRETLDHPAASAAIEHECAACHMPMARFGAEIAGAHLGVFAQLPVGQLTTPTARLAADGVSCTLCHQIRADGLGEESSFTAGFRVDTETPLGQRGAFGPYPVDPGQVTIMRSASRFEPRQRDHLARSEVCATCHTLYTHALSPEGEVVGELPEQVPYLEWLHSDYAQRRSCQDCHMPVVDEETPVSGVLGPPRPALSRHVFRGGNFFMPRVLSAHRGELGVVALPSELELTARRTREHLETSAARVEIEEASLAGERLGAVVALTNLAGHKLPTAYPSRRAWLHLTVTDRNGETVFESGAFRADGSIAGNDNDEEASRFEPHHPVIDEPGKVQVYEAILADSDGSVTTGLISAVGFAKDNRLLPTGFDKATADEDVAVHGAASGDADFRAGGDRVRVSVDVAGAEGPFHLVAELWYQPVAYRWAQNLGRYDAGETERFVAYYDGQAAASGTVLARAAATVD